MQGPRLTDRWPVIVITGLVGVMLASCASPTKVDSGTGTAPTLHPITASVATTLARGIDSEIWRPGPGVTWQWQLSGEIDTTVDAQMFDVDLFETPPAVIRDLHDRGRTVICYLSAGSWEDSRPDADSFPEAVLGKSNGWAGERWLDIRRLDVLGPIMEARLDRCRSKGFDGVEADNVDAYANDTGFSITAEDQLTFNRFLADAAHARGLSIGLKNDGEQAAILEPSFDWAINEQCAQYHECDLFTPFIDAGKAVFHVEYDLGTDRFCPITTELGFSSMKKHRTLDAWRRPCP